MNMEGQIDIKKLCRLCLSSDNKITGLLDNEDLENIYNKIYSCLLVEISETDELSQKICDDCLNKVEEFYSYRQFVNENQEKFTKLLTASKCEKIKVEAEEKSGSLADDLEFTEVGCSRDGDLSDIFIEDENSHDASISSPIINSSIKVSREKHDNPLDLRCSTFEINEGGSKLDKDPCKKKKIHHCCEKCSKSFSSLRTLLKHLSRIHIKNQTFSCSKCNLNFKNSDQLKVHNWGHKEKYVCDKCSYFSYSSSNFKLHLMKHNGEFLAICEDCGKGFFRMSSYKEHKLKKHSQEILVYKCDKCDKAYNSRGYFLQHIKVHEPHYQRKDYQCEICGKTFLSWNSIKRHVLSFHKGAKFKCDLCSKEVTSRQSLMDHKKTHTGEKSYICDECGKAFRRWSGLVVHRRIHSGEKPYSCDLCNKTFSQRSTLTVHLRSHTGEKPYLCQKCNKRFVTRTLLNGHLKTHTDD